MMGLFTEDIIGVHCLLAVATLESKTFLSRSRFIQNFHRNSEFQSPNFQICPAPTLEG